MSLHPHLIEIDGGTVPGHPGKYLFLVDLVEEDGGRLGLWHGHDYGLAIIEAEHARRDFEIEQPVRDRIGGAS